MRTIQLVFVSLGTLLSVACDGPGGGGGGVNCVSFPTAPACQLADTTSSSDTIPTPGDSGNNTATSPADTTSADTTSGQCVGSSRRCDGNQPQQCLDNAWQDVSACAADETCVSGNCVADQEDCCVGMECGTDCGVSCGTCGPTNHCSDGECVANTCIPQCGAKECGSDGCGGSCGACASNETCQSSQCVPATTGGADCGQTIDCIYGATGCAQFEDETQFGECADACLVAASQTGADELDALLQCDASCAGDGICYAEQCGFVQSQCLFDSTGSGGCTDIFGCMQGCGSGDDICVTDCYESSTATAQGQAIGYVLCLNNVCPAGSPQTCADDAIAGDCANVYNACVSN